MSFRIAIEQSFAHWYVAINWTPVFFADEDLARFVAVLEAVLPLGYATIIEHWHLSYFEAALDFKRDGTDLVAFAGGTGKSRWYPSFKGPTRTLYLGTDSKKGKPDSSFALYPKASAKYPDLAQLSTKGISLPYNLMRFEARRRGQFWIKMLHSIPNPFQRTSLITLDALRAFGPQQAIKMAKDKQAMRRHRRNLKQHRWRLFDPAWKFPERWKQAIRILYLPLDLGLFGDSPNPSAPCVPPPHIVDIRERLVAKQKAKKGSPA